MASQIHLNEKFLSKSTLMSYCDMLENESSISTIIQIEHVKKKNIKVAINVYYMGKEEIVLDTMKMR